MKEPLLLSLSEKDMLLGCGYKLDHIIELPDGGAILNLDMLRMEWSQKLLHLARFD